MNNPLNDENALRLKRLRYRSQHRGNKEMDLIMGQFAHARLEALSELELAVYERLLEENDVDLWDWVVGKTPPTDNAYVPMISMLKTYIPTS